MFIFCYNVANVYILQEYAKSYVTHQGDTKAKRDNYF
jgi:hypothetical protein